MDTPFGACHDPKLVEPPCMFVQGGFYCSNYPSIENHS